MTFVVAFPSLSLYHTLSTWSAFALHEVLEWKKSSFYQVALQAFKAFSKLFHLFHEKSTLNPSTTRRVSPLVPSPSPCPSSHSSIQKSPKIQWFTAQKLKKIAHLCFFMEILRIAKYIPGMGTSMLGVVANLFSFAGSALMVRAETSIERTELSHHTVWKKTGHYIAIISYSTSAAYVALKILKQFSSASSLPTLTSATYVMGALSISFTVTNTVYHFIYRRQEISARCLSILNCFRRSISSSFFV